MELVYIAAITLLSYLIGGTPVGSLIARINRVDIASQGSGKTGTTNVLRTVGRRAAALVLLGDFLKGTIAVIAARLISPLFLGSTATLTILDQTIRVLTLGTVVAAVVVVTGHVFSLYLRIVHGAWKGGRGVVTAMGAAI